jgi:hypothetical protein
MGNPKDVADYALKNKDLMQAAQDNPEVSRTFVGLVDRIIELFGDKAGDLEIKGPVGAPEPYDVKFILGDPHGAN